MDGSGANNAITRHDFEQRRNALAALQRHLLAQEAEFTALREEIQRFIDRYVGQLAPLYMELDALQSQLHRTTSELAEGLRRSGIDARIPRAPKATDIAPLPRLPAGAPQPSEPPGGVIELGPPPLKTLYRRAAKRLHPDLAADERSRREREQQMMAANQAYAHGDRAELERLLLAAGEDPVKVRGGNADAIRHWLIRSEFAAQGRLRVVQAHLALLNLHPMRELGHAIVRAEARGLDPLDVMASRLRSQIAERRQQVYIGQRLQPESDLARQFLHELERRADGYPIH
ncbi:J domain-containing protein [Paucibacter sp. R3-3]|uniref:J domain-containing protein n=1 Tax=Roseateles agri TaxID=3098619 RepID=A0ABU5DNZ9_9BURK|nr:J domain-containing protein [Paucibacter sp. R3-3]MDY0747014.1 J domain-containing protein [Paucibacter sp. R3-3]